MNLAQRSIFRSQQTVLLAEQEAQSYFAKDPLFPVVQTRMYEGNRELEREGTTDPACEPNLFLAKVLDLTGQQYLEMVRDMDSHAQYKSLLYGVRLRALQTQFPDSFGPVYFSGDSALERLLGARVEHWINEGYKRLVAAPDEGKERSGKRISYRSQIDSWMMREGIKTIDIAARKLAVSVDVLKSIRSDKGRPRFSKDTLTRILVIIGVTKK